MLFPDALVLIRGGGDLASGVALRVARAGFRLVITELDHPLAVRRAVAFASAIEKGEWVLEGVKAVHAHSVEAARKLSAKGIVPVLIDPGGASIPALKPRVLVDARMTKSAEDIRTDSAPLVIGLGPGFVAGVNCHAVIETNRGPFLGRAYWRGAAEGNTGKPEAVMGLDYQRVLRAPRNGLVEVRAAIGDSVVGNQVVAMIDSCPIKASFAGAVRGLIADRTPVTAGTKIGDIDPRGRPEYCFMVSDKSLAVGGGVLEAILTWMNRD